MVAAQSTEVGPPDLEAQGTEVTGLVPADRRQLGGGPDAAAGYVDPAPLPNSSDSEQWKQQLQVKHTLKAAKLSGGWHPLELEIGGADDLDKRLLYTYFNLHKRWPTEQFLASMDGPPGRVALLKMGTLGRITSLVWSLSLIPLAIGLWRWGDCARNPSFTAFGCWGGDGSIHDWCAVLASLMTLPG